MTPSPNSPPPLATPVNADAPDNFGVPHDQRDGPGTSGIHPSWAAWFNSLWQSRDVWVDFASQIVIQHLGTPTLIARYSQAGKTVNFRLKVTGVSDGSPPIITLPSPAKDTAQTFSVYIFTGGNTLSGWAKFLTATTVQVGFYDNRLWTNTQSYIVVVQGPYEVN